MVEKLQLIVDIYIEEVYKSESVAANFKLEHKLGISKKHRVSDKVLGKYNSIAASVIATIQSFRECIDIGSIHQSGKSYTVYIPLSAKELPDIEIIIRLHDHTHASAIPEVDRDSKLSRVVVKDIRMNGEAVNNLIGLIDVIYDICMGLSEGNIHPLLEVDYNE